jgi:hypothetical protein
MLLRQKANSDIMLEVYAEIEEKFTADSGHSTIVPLHPEWNTVGIQLSGGLDSALLMYLTTLAIKKHGLKTKIQPISVFIPSKVKNIASTVKIIDKVRELTDGHDIINDGLVFRMPMEETSTEDGKKDGFFIKTIRQLFKDKVIDFEYNGNTKNPPDEARVGWKNDQWRQKNRDNAESIYNSTHGASPHYGMDKADIINLYLKYPRLYEEVAPLTCSCDENVTVVDSGRLNVPCGNCWWCEERKYGFSTNGVEDPAPVLTYEEYCKLVD